MFVTLFFLFFNEILVIRVFFQRYTYFIKILKFHPSFFSIFSLATILVGSWEHWTHFWKGAIQGSFHQSLVQIDLVASEELIKM
jgi:hypothetical protein